MKLLWQNLLCNTANKSINITACHHSFFSSMVFILIADVLRHRDLDTTKIYTKINIPMLREVALPWPEVMI
ncbi:MAG: hypothetical protein A2560_11850 [Bdellovibrionales bacterium RIFOXYD1_FULL_39_84]|nr:MAG: hypothetical protein A2560_11850 [Bdellovibrionales bacterium RIFOXYD1_FULL_39_84]